VKKILVADDRAISRELVRSVLESCGYEVYEAADGLEALEQAHQVHPDVIILDLQMPRLDGFGVVSELRRDPAFDHVPVMALTASAMTGDRERALASGFTGYVAKPIRVAALRGEVERMVELTRPSTVSVTSS
jgi:two-component system cell cycle response regulator DivK